MAGGAVGGDALEGGGEFFGGRLGGECYFEFEGGGVAVLEGLNEGGGLGLSFGGAEELFEFFAKQKGFVGGVEVGVVRRGFPVGGGDLFEDVVLVLDGDHRFGHRWNVGGFGEFGFGLSEFHGR